MDPMWNISGIVYGTQVAFMWGDSGITIWDMCGVLGNKRGSPHLFANVIKL